jgi:hypothetical protein
LVQLQAKILADGYEFTLGEAQRSAEQAAINALSLYDRARIRALLETKYPVLADAIGCSVSRGIKNSNHRNRLAIDLNLYKDDRYLDDAADYLRFGEFWKSLHPLARWGGDFGDSDHFSFEYNGVK